MRSAGPMTPESVQQAKTQTQAEREAIARQTGVRITDQAKCYIAICPRPGCRHTVSARSMGRLDRGLAAHLVWHVRKEQA